MLIRMIMDLNISDNVTADNDMCSATSVSGARNAAGALNTVNSDVKSAETNSNRVSRYGRQIKMPT